VGPQNYRVFKKLKIARCLREEAGPDEWWTIGTWLCLTQGTYGKGLRGRDVFLRKAYFFNYG